jgi:electron transfer flavoprotein alpha/beta subunit
MAHKKLERGMREAYVLPLPALLGLDPGINLPRYVAPYSKVYCRGLKRSVERVTAKFPSEALEKRVSMVRLCQRKPRVKKGINISALSMQDRLRMMKGEFGDKKRKFQGEPAAAAKEILKEIKG